MNSIAAEIAELACLACAEVEGFSHLIIAGRKKAVGDFYGYAPILDFVVPLECCWIVTEVGAKSIPLPAGDVALGGPAAYGAFASEEEVTPYSEGVFGQATPTAYWKVDGAEIMDWVLTPEMLSRPVLFVFRGGSQVYLWIRTQLPAGGSEHTDLYAAVNGYLVPAAVGACLQPYSMLLFRQRVVVED